MASITYKGTDEMMETLIRLAEHGRDVTSAALYAGAGVMADALKASAQTLPVGTPKGNSPSGHPYTGLTPEDAEDIAGAVGIAPFDRKGDTVDTVVGFDGYTRRAEKGYPQGVPIPMLVRSLEAGSSVRTKRPFVRTAVNGAKAGALSAMKEAGEDKINEYLGG